MKASEVVTQMILLLPQLTDKLTNDVSVNSLTRSGSVITAACDEPHLLKPGNAVSIVGAITPITISDLKRSGVVGTAVTAADHDVTSKNAQPNVTLSGSATSEFNGTFPFLDAPDSRTIRFTMADSGPTIGNPTNSILEDGESILRRYNTTYAVLETPTPTTFTFLQANTTIPNPVGTIVARTKPRVGQGVDPDRLVSLYTEKKVNELWAFVVLEDVAASKSRDIRSDAIDGLQRGSFYRQQVIQPFTIYLFVPVTRSISGMDGRDHAEDLFRDICRSVLFGQFSSGLAVGKQGPVQFVSHGTFRYDTAVYVHAFNFQQTVDLGFDDTVGPDVDVAFRCIDMKLTPDLGGIQFLQSSAINLNEFVEQNFSTQFGTLISRKGLTTIPPDPDPFHYANTNPQLLGIANALSVGFWINPLNPFPSTGELDQGIFELGSFLDGNVNMIRLTLNAGLEPNSRLGFELYDSAGVLFKRIFFNTPANITWQTGAWQFLLFTYDGSLPICYFNGVALTAVSVTDNAGTMTDTTRQIFIGFVERGLQEDEVFDGMMHSVGMWSSALGATEALALYNGGDGKGANWYADLGAYVSSDNLKHWWRLGLDPNDPGKDYGTAAVLLDVDQNSFGDLVLVKSAP